MDLADHFADHGARLGISTQDEYETFADEFLQPTCPATAIEFVRRRNGDTVRYDETADVFAVLARDRVIKTCYRPDPAFHGEATNKGYFLSERAKR